MNIQIQRQGLFLVLISVFLLSRQAESIRFDLESGHTKCISEDIKSNSMTVGKYQIVNPNEGHPLPESHKITVRVIFFLVFSKFKFLLFFILFCVLYFFIPVLDQITKRFRGVCRLLLFLLRSVSLFISAKFACIFFVFFVNLIRFYMVLFFCCETNLLNGVDNFKVFLSFRCGIWVLLGWESISFVLNGISRENLHYMFPFMPSTV